MNNNKDNLKTESLIPGGCIQFLDMQLDLSSVLGYKRHFYEYTFSEDQYSEANVYLMCLDIDKESNQYINRETMEPAVNPSSNGRVQPVDPSYSLKAEESIEVFLNQWIPLPFFRTNNEKGQGSIHYDYGPTNWARVRISQLKESDNAEYSHTITIAFDTQVEEDQNQQSEEDNDDFPVDDIEAGDNEQELNYPALIHNDVEEGEQFSLAYHENDIGWFLGLEWVDAWIADVFYQYLKRKKKREVKERDYKGEYEHISYYLTFLDVLNKFVNIPNVKLINPNKQASVDVDLILDVGNSRTCGIMIETGADDQINFNDAYRLELRNLTSPQIRYQEPFTSRIEFAMASFGDPNKFSMASGRYTTAFSWPTVVRIGEEATQLGLHSRAAEGLTGMSSPKRYLWDQFNRRQEWRFNSGYASAISREEPVTKGVFVKYINDQGTPLANLDDNRIRRDPAFRDQSRFPVSTTHFSRSSIMMFMLSEIIAHALVTMNSPEQRKKQKYPDLPRRLRRIILTMPTAMSIVERKVFSRWAEWAVETTWKALGWEDAISHKGFQSQNAANLNDYRLSPEIRYDCDEASATQLVYLYNEIDKKFRGDSQYVFQILGKLRAETELNKETLRIASIDIGGGTTDLIITTYESLGSGAATVIKPVQEFREGFNIAGDDILRSVVESHFLQSLKQALTEFGVRDAKAVMTELVGGDFAGDKQTQKDRALRQQFCNQVAVPIGLKILNIYEEKASSGSYQHMTVGFGEFFSGTDAFPRQDVINHVDQIVAKMGGSGFSLMELEFKIDLAAVERTICNEIGPVLLDLCEIVHIYDCDVLLLSGRPSRLPAVMKSVLSKLPLPPNRIIPMHRYRVGNWYPFRSLNSRISDPKTTAAVGAVLSVMAEGHLDAFSFQSHLLKPKSTARFVGELEISGQIKADKVFFPALDLDGREEVELEHEFEFYAPIFIGFRQLEAERWAATPFYRLSFSNGEAIKNARGRLPYKVTIGFVRDADDDDDDIASRIGDLRSEGAFTIDEITAADGGPVKLNELDLRLQTLKDEAGYWLDTGIFSIV